MKEPKRDKNIDHLEPYVAVRVRQVLDAMRGRGYDAIAFETKRSKQRQQFLFGIGRKYQLNRRPVTYLDGVHKVSMHQLGKACDIISKSRGWDWPEFFTALKTEANKAGLRVLRFERCHVQWG